MSIETSYFSEGKARQNSHCVILVEGKDDALFLSAVLTDIGADPNLVGIVDVEGNSKFPSELRSFLKSPSFTQGINRSVAIVCDADEDPAAIVKQINKVLTTADQPLLPVGIHVLNAKGVRFGLFTMPDCASNGDLEKLCLDTMAGHPLETQAENFICAAETHAKAQLKLMKGSRHKRKAQAYLATIPEGLVRGAGQGFAKGYFDQSHARLDPLRDFLRETIKP